MAARSKARKRALDILFEAEARGVSALGLLDDRVEAQDPPVNAYTVVLVTGVVEHRERIDGLLSTYSEGWTLDRMPAVDRAALRLGVLELLYVDETPDAVAISEAMSLVRDLSTDESPAFVNGVLANILRNKPALSA
jgi:N utilization substance protein B